MKYEYPYEGCLEYPHISRYAAKGNYHTLLPEEAQDALKNAAEQARVSKGQLKEVVMDAAARFVRTTCRECFRDEKNDPIKYRGWQDMMRGEQSGKEYRRQGGYSEWYKNTHKL